MEIENKCLHPQDCLHLVSNLTLGPCQKTECHTRLSLLHILLSLSHTLAEDSEASLCTFGSSADWPSSAQPVLASPSEPNNPFLSSQWTLESSTGNMDFILNHRFVQRLSETFFLWNANQE